MHFHYCVKVEGEQIRVNVRQAGTSTRLTRKMGITAICLLPKLILLCTLDIRPHCNQILITSMSSTHRAEAAARGSSDDITNLLSKTSTASEDLSKQVNDYFVEQRSAQCPTQKKNSLDPSTLKSNDKDKNKSEIGNQLVEKITRAVKYVSEAADLSMDQSSICVAPNSVLVRNDKERISPLQKSKQYSLPVLELYA